MKTFSIVAVFLLALVAHGATAVRFDGQGRDQDDEQTNNDSGFTYDQERIYDNSDSVSDSNGFIRGTGSTAKYANVKTTTTHNGRFDNDNSKWRDTNDNHRIDQSDRQIQFIRSNEEFSSEQHEIQAADNAHGSATYGLDIVRKIAALNRIVDEQRRRNGNLLDMESPLPVKKSVVKVTKHNFVNFQSAELSDLNLGTLEYLSIDPENDVVSVECAFSRLGANGTFKTNLPHTKRGSFAVDMYQVRGGVSAGFHRGRADVRPATFGTVRTSVTADDRHDVDTINGTLAKNYRNVLERAISGAMFDCTFKGVVARLKDEVKTLFEDVVHGDHRATKLYDVDWTEGDLNIRIADVGGGRSHSWNGVHHKVESMSYTLKDDNTYKVHVDVGLGGLKWTSDLTVVHRGQRDQAPSVQFSTKDLRIHVAVFKSTDNQKCRKIETNVKINGLQYDKSGKHTTCITPLVEQKLPRFIQHSLESYMYNLLLREVCNGRIDNQ